MGKVIIIGCILISCSSCSGFMATNSDNGQFTLSGDERGVQAFGDMISGVITNGKHSADAQDSPFYDLRRMQENGRTTRKVTITKGRGHATK